MYGLPKNYTQFSSKTYTLKLITQLIKPQYCEKKYPINFTLVVNNVEVRYKDIENTLDLKDPTKEN